ncbi:MAG: DUF5682 family protein, partial [Pseudomonadota bacterium]
MTDASRLASLAAALVQPDRGLYLAPIRHHSPACAWAVRALIREVRPDAVLIEAPVDTAAQIPMLLDKDTRPPVAVASLVPRETGPRVAAYSPYCAHSPEYVALCEGHAIGAELAFIDLPSGDKVMLADPPEDVTTFVDNEAHFDSGDVVDGLCRATGCRNGYELWDHLFESRLGQPDWATFFRDVAAYCASLRDATSDDALDRKGDTAREAHMADRIADALAAGWSVVVVTGGFH